MGKTNMASAAAQDAPEQERKKAKKRTRIKKRWFNLFFTIIVIMITTMAMLLIYGLAFMLYKIRAIPALSFPHVSLILFIFAVTTVVVIALIAFFWGRLPLSPLNRLIDAMHRLSQGDYSVRLRDSRIHIFNELTRSFNKMAEELGNTEMLRADFVNNFSHEFKTPLMSIKGFAGLLSREDLTDAQREEYLRIIENESDRLASMTTNIMDLTNLENLEILSNVTRLNISEQIRQCILLRINDLEKKKLELSAEFDEYYVSGSDDLLRRVWANLIDNAIKYAGEGGAIDVSISEHSDVCKIAVHNTGSFIPEEERERIFSKFYQTDKSHSGQGCGLGLAIVKRIVTLHRGVISVKSDLDEGTTFTVYLPVNVS